MSRIGRRVRAAVNPLSTAATRWWCHSALRFRLTGSGPAVGRARVIRLSEHRDAGYAPSDEHMQARVAAVNQLLGQHERSPQPGHMTPGLPG